MFLSQKRYCTVSSDVHVLGLEVQLTNTFTQLINSLWLFENVQYVWRLHVRWDHIKYKQGVLQMADYGDELILQLIMNNC